MKKYFLFTVSSIDFITTMCYNKEKTTQKEDKHYEQINTCRHYACQGFRLP